MLKGRNMIGKSIIAYATGEKVAQVRDLIFDYHKNQVLGFLVVEQGWLKKGKAVATAAVRSIGPDSIIISHKDAVKDLTQLPVLKAVVEEDQALIHAQILTLNGQNLGTIIDLYFDDQTWRVKGYEASGGLFADIYSGRSFIPAPQTIEIGKDYAFVEPEVADKMKEQAGGLEAQLHDVGEKLHTAATSAQEQWQDLSAAAQEKLQATQQSLGEKAQTMISQPVLENAKGRRVQQEVCTDDGRFVAAPGLIVTEEVIEQARQYGLEAELMQAVGLTPSKAFSQAARTRLHKAQQQLGNLTHRSGNSLHQSTHHLQERWRDLWRNTTDRVSHLQQGTSQAFAERRIRSVIGCHVSRTILDLQDNVILQEGDIITHGAVEQARAANVLEVLIQAAECRSGHHPEVVS